MTSFRSAPSMNTYGWMGAHTDAPPPPLALFLWISLINTWTTSSWKYYFLHYDTCWVLKTSFSQGVLIYWGHQPESQELAQTMRVIFSMGFLSKIAEMRIYLVIHRCDLCHLSSWNALRHGQTPANKYLAKANAGWRGVDRSVTLKPAHLCSTIWPHNEVWFTVLITGLCTKHRDVGVNFKRAVLCITGR